MTAVLRTAVVIGCGTTGTSVALALTGAGVRVSLIDENPQAVTEAVALGAGTAWSPRLPPADLVVVATTPSSVVDVLHSAQSRGLGHVYTDTAGTKDIVCAEAELRGCDLKGYVPGHPLAGPDAPDRARADAGRFAGRPWVVCPYETTPDWAFETVDALIETCGAQRVDMTVEEHDRAAAVLLHLPYLVAAVLAATVGDSDPRLLRLAGGRPAGILGAAEGDPVLGSDVLTQNAGPVADAIDLVTGQLDAVARMLHQGEDTVPVELSLVLERGRRGLRALDAAADNTAP
ncbi:prephenate dehydrogenase/arogenate dehydrogenase family protein [Streptomyces sp. NWU49]|uniref:prephenate dehydrogenase n=1 Tax=Streptomyces sp. NWU49 TaxID=2201153 RepID=UPI000D67F0D6|nr:prephenate dehydrogenase/arogenate dehydrogenase family protein [Streptomyces sp. NWU49]PWJ04803.1 prephenate dehydrogenase/arogenate dehydrogenase family protein [Streptomyces sp. NWU49]